MFKLNKVSSSRFKNYISKGDDVLVASVEGGYNNQAYEKSFKTLLELLNYIDCYQNTSKSIIIRNDVEL